LLSVSIEKNKDNTTAYENKNLALLDIGRNSSSSKKKIEKANEFAADKHVNNYS
jgi:hypothetical protein